MLCSGFRCGLGQAACAADLSVPAAVAPAAGPPRCGPCGCLGVAYVYHRSLESTYGVDFDPRNYDRQCLITISVGYVPIHGTLSTAFPFKDPATRPPSASLGALNSRQLDPLALLAGHMALDRSIDAILAAFFSGPFIFNLGHGALPKRR